MLDQGLIGLPLLTETEFPISIISRTGGSGAPATPSAATWGMYSQDWGSPITTGTYDIGTDSKTGFCTDTVDLSAIGSLESGKTYYILSAFVISSTTYRVLASFQPQ